MTEKPLVSVIINCYNGEKYLREAIDSVIAQTYENWELVFWDNQSTDSTREIVESYKNPKIRYFYAPEHTTLGEARNHSMDCAVGELMCFLDADDFWSSEFLFQAVNAIIMDKDISLCYCRYWKFTAKSRWPVIGGNSSGFVPVKSLISKYNIGMSAAVFRRRIIEDYCIKFDNRFSLIEDFDFFLKIAAVGKIYYLSDCLMYYRIHGSNSSKSDRWNEELGIMLENIEGNPSYSKLKRYKRGVGNLKNHYLIQDLLKKGRKQEAIKVWIKRIPYDIGSLRYAVSFLFGLDFYSNIRRKIVLLKSNNE